jgi:hypothetical protein
MPTKAPPKPKQPAAATRKRGRSAPAAANPKKEKAKKNGRVELSLPPKLSQEKKAEYTHMYKRARKCLCQRTQFRVLAQLPDGAAVQHGIRVELGREIERRAKAGLIKDKDWIAEHLSAILTTLDRKAAGAASCDSCVLVVSPAR